jgi:hypothetical protein
MGFYGSPWVRYRCSIITIDTARRPGVTSAGMIVFVLVYRDRKALVKLQDAIMLLTLSNGRIRVPIEIEKATSP